MKVYSYFPLQILISFINVCSASAIRLIPNQSYNDSSLQINNQITALMESRHGLSSGGFHVHCHACASCLAKNGGKRLFLAEEMKGRIRWLQRGVAQLDAAHACIWVCMHVAPTYTYICVRTCFADVHCCIGFYSKFWCCAPSSNFDQRSLFNQSRTSQRRFSYRLILYWVIGFGRDFKVEFLLCAWRLLLVSRTLFKILGLRPSITTSSQKDRFSTNQNVALRTRALFVPTDLIGFGHDFMVEGAYW